MSIIDEAAEEGADSSTGAPPECRPSPDRPAIRLRHKKHGKVDNGRLRPTSIHIFEDLEKNGVIPDQALSSYKSLARSQRMSRTMQALYSIDPKVAKDVFETEGASLSSDSARPASMFDFRSNPCSPSPPPAARSVFTCKAGSSSSSRFANWSPERLALASRAALTIQRHFRGFLGRRRYAARLWEVYAAEEEKQRGDKVKDLVEETEILVAARKAVIDMEELETTKRNAERLLVSRVVTIQRAWRAHRACVVREMPNLAQSRLANRGPVRTGEPRREESKGKTWLPPPPSSISCDSIAESAMRPGGGSVAAAALVTSSPRLTGAILRPGSNSVGLDRESIRLQLAMEDDDDGDGLNQLDVRFVGTSPARRRFSDEGFLEVTLNDIVEDAEAEAVGAGALAAANDTSVDVDVDAEVAAATDAAASLSLREPLPRPKNAFHDACDLLRKETEIQLAQSPALAQLQMELEKSEKEVSPSIVDTFQQLKNMVKEDGVDEAEIANLNVASLQVLVNDLLTRVETNNEELMALLQERDQLHMEQDSMLVDIEDLIKQCKRQAELNNRRGIPR